jgi:hypothetical protein
VSVAAFHRVSFPSARRSRPRDTAASATLDRADVLWIEVETGLWVGRVEGEFRGMIELTSEGFAATDGCGSAAGVHPNLVRAKRALVGPAGARAAWRRVTGG